MRFKRFLAGEQRFRLFKVEIDEVGLSVLFLCGALTNASHNGGWGALIWNMLPVKFKGFLLALSLKLTAVYVG